MIMSFSDRSYCSCVQCWMTGLSVSQFELCTSHQDQIGATSANTESHFPTKNKKHTRLPRITLLIAFRQKQLRQRDLFSILLIRDYKHIEKPFHLLAYLKSLQRQEIVKIEDQLLDPFQHRNLNVAGQLRANSTLFNRIKRANYS